ncbi:MAG: cobyric acid synthase [Aeromonadaceae bacterium]
MTLRHNQTLMVQGTSSDAGKSLLVTALCRIFAQAGHKVAPFKPQNMALNSAVTADGGEIGRAQAVQALAAGLPPHVDFNPILLKPNTDTGCQVIIHGRVVTDMEAQAYHDYKQVAMSAVLESHHRLRQQYSRIIVEGAGSPAEINLREGDIANMGFAEVADCPVIVIADIDRGGVFAQLVGTLELLSPSEQARVKGFVINKFRGDIKLLEPGLEWLEKKTGKPVLGVLPYLHGLDIAAEDAILTQQHQGATQLRVVVPVLPHISNHTDFDPLRLHPEIDLQFVSLSQTLPPCDLVILPGSKNVRDDLAQLRQQGWDVALRRHLRYGGKLLGICGGYQMLGETIADPLGLEGAPGRTPGLGLLPLHTELKATKQLTLTQGQLLLGNRAVAVTGYEIHLGQTQAATARSEAITPLLQLTQGGYDGWQSADGQIAGCYLHGLLDTPQALQAVARWAGATISPPVEYHTQQQMAIARLATCVEQHLDMGKIEALFTNDWRDV